MTYFNVADNKLIGALSTRSERFNESLKRSTWCARTGELPLEIIRMLAKGVDVCLNGNAGFTLPSNIGELGDGITVLNIASCSLIGPLSIRTEHMVLVLKFLFLQESCPRNSANLPI